MRGSTTTEHHYEDGYVGRHRKPEDTPREPKESLLYRLFIANPPKHLKKGAK
jgi:hypothetical protein